MESIREMKEKEGGRKGGKAGRKRGRKEEEEEEEGKGMYESADRG